MQSRSLCWTKEKIAGKGTHEQLMKTCDVLGNCAVPAFRGGVGMSNRRPQRGPWAEGRQRPGLRKRPKILRELSKADAVYPRYWFSLIVMLVFAVASTVFTIIGPKILGNATNKLVEGISQQMVHDKVKKNKPLGGPDVKPKGNHRRRPVMDLMPQEQREMLSQSQTDMLMG